MVNMNISPSNYKRQDQKQSDKTARMQQLVDEGLASGVSDETMSDILIAMEADAASPDRDYLNVAR